MGWLTNAPITSGFSTVVLAVFWGAVVTAAVVRILLARRRRRAIRDGALRPLLDSIAVESVFSGLTPGAMGRPQETGSAVTTSLVAERRTDILGRAARTEPDAGRGPDPASLG